MKFILLAIIIAYFGFNGISANHGNGKAGKMESVWQDTTPKRKLDTLPKKHMEDTINKYRRDTLNKNDNYKKRLDTSVITS